MRSFTLLYHLASLGRLVYLQLKGKNVSLSVKTEPKTRSKNEHKRESILQAASTLFCEQGFISTSMEKVAKLAGVSKQTVYSHFGNKDDLFVSAIVCKCEKFELLSNQNEMSLNPRTTLQTFAKRFISMLLSDEGIAIHRVCAAEASKNPKISKLFFTAGPERIIAKVTECFAYYHEKSILNINDPHCAAIQFVSMIRGEAVMRREYNTDQQLSEQQIADYIKDCIDLFLKGYAVET